MLNSFSKIGILFGCLFLTACNSVSYISINVKTPANIVFPANVQDVIILNGIDSIRDAGNHVFEYESKRQEMDFIETDTLLTVLCNSLWVNLAEQQFFNRVDFLNVPLNDKQLKIESVLQQVDADAIIMLIDMGVQSKLSLKNIADYDVLRSVYEVTTQAEFALSDLNSDWKKNITVKDTIFWEAFGWDANDALTRLPYLDEALIESAHQVAALTMQKMIPHWSVEYRRYYTSATGGMKNAAKFVKSNDWEKAYQIWVNEYDAATGKKKAKCAANIALYHEMQNELENALNWATKSLTGFEDAGKDNKESITYIKDYMLRLQLRQKENALLDMQEGID